MKNKVILSGLFLTGAISCSSFKPFILTDAFLYPETITEVSYKDLNWSYALFNQYASGLSYTLRLDYSTISPAAYPIIDQAVQFYNAGVLVYFDDWDIQTPNYSEAKLDSVFTKKLNDIFFDREFDETTGKALYNDFLILVRQAALNIVNFEIIIDSKISYRVNVGAAFMAFQNLSPAGGVDQYYKYIDFYNTRDELLQTFLLDQDRTSLYKNYYYELSTILTNVNRFRLKFQWVDIPPFATSDFVSYISEFALFTQGQEINIPDEVDGDRFGFEFVAVEWWDILGHLQNFAWWIVNQSPIAPVFEWLDTYIISWISGLITFITGVFRL